MTLLPSTFEEIFEQNKRRIRYHIHRLNIQDPPQECFQVGTNALWQVYEKYQPDRQTQQNNDGNHVTRNGSSHPLPDRHPDEIPLPDDSDLWQTEKTSDSHKYKNIHHKGADIIYEMIPFDQVVDPSSDQTVTSSNNSSRGQLDIASWPIHKQKQKIETRQQPRASITRYATRYARYKHYLEYFQLCLYLVPVL